MSDIIIPNFGDSITTATIACWNAPAGAHVKAGDVLVTLESDKVAQELEAQEDGILEILIPEGQDVNIGDVIGRISESSGHPTTIPTNTTKPQATSHVPEGSLLPPVSESLPFPSEPTPVTEAVVSSDQEQPNATPRYTRTRMSSLRRALAARLVDVQHQSAMLTTFNECDMSAIIELRRQFKELPNPTGRRLGFMSFFIKAVVGSLQEVPQVNARIDGDDIITNHYYDISIAVGTDKGLTVPVLRDCDQKDHLQLESELALLAEKARNNKLSLEDLQGGVFTITNGGVYGSMMSTPIINPPQSAILGMHSIIERPVVQDGQIVIRPMMYLALSYDHRLIDGKQAVTFLCKVKELIENPVFQF